MVSTAAESSGCPSSVCCSERFSSVCCSWHCSADFAAAFHGFSVFVPLGPEPAGQYAYESISYWDKEKKQPRSKRKYLGKVDPETGDIIPFCYG
jgi:hypothetical protein